MEYKGYTIEPETDPWDLHFGNNFFFYPTNEGISHDGDFDGQDFKYCGNCRWAGSIEEAQDQIDEITL